MPRGIHIIFPPKTKVPSWRSPWTAGRSFGPAKIFGTASHPRISNDSLKDRIVEVVRTSAVCWRHHRASSSWYHAQRGDSVRYAAVPWRRRSWHGQVPFYRNCRQLSSWRDFSAGTPPPENVLALFCGKISVGLIANRDSRTTDRTINWLQVANLHYKASFRWAEGLSYCWGLRG